MGKLLILDELKPRVNIPKSIDPTTKKRKRLTDDEFEDKKEKEQLELDALVSEFETTLTKQRKRLKKRKQTLTDSAGNIAILTAMLKMTISIIPIAEKQYQRYKNDRAAQSIVLLAKQARDLSADIQRLGGAASAAPVIINQVVMPNFQHLLQNNLNEGSIAIKALKELLPKEYHKKCQEVINSLIKNQSNYMSQINLAISEKIEKYFDEK